MTIEIKIECDASNCFSEKEIEEDDIDRVENAGWHHHPDDETQHYCPVCWPVIKKELLSEVE